MLTLYKLINLPEFSRYFCYIRYLRQRKRVQTTFLQKLKCWFAAR